MEPFWRKLASLVQKAGSPVFVRLWFHIWRLFCLYLFLISPFFGPSGSLCFVIVAFSRNLLLIFFTFSVCLFVFLLLFFASSLLSRIIPFRIYFVVVLSTSCLFPTVYVLLLTCPPLINAIYSRLSLSRTRLSRITAYLEVKIWSLF